MNSVKRDFSIAAIEHMSKLIKESVDKEEQFFLCDWFEDTFCMGDLDIHDYLNNVDTYQAHMADKYDINTKKFEKIIQRVYDVDGYYSGEFGLINESINNLHTKILSIAGMIGPQELSVDTQIYGRALDKIDEAYSVEETRISNELKELNKKKPQTRDIPWYEKALNATGGFAFEFVRATAEGTTFLIGEVLECFTDFDHNEQLRDIFDLAENYIVDNWITDKVAFYNGSVAGDAVVIANGVYTAAQGINTFLGGIAAATFGAGLSASVVGAVGGVSVMAVSILAVAVGVASTSIGGSVAYVAYGNGKDNISKARSGGTSGTKGGSYKNPVSGKTGKETSKDVPSWAKGNKPKTTENGNDFATRLCDEKYGKGNYPKGLGSEHNKI